MLNGTCWCMLYTIMPKGTCWCIYVPFGMSVCWHAKLLMHTIYHHAKRDSLIHTLYNLSKRDLLIHIIYWHVKRDLLTHYCHAKRDILMHTDTVMQKGTYWCIPDTIMPKGTYCHAKRGHIDAHHYHDKWIYWCTLGLCTIQMYMIQYHYWYLLYWWCSRYINLSFIMYIWYK